MTGILRPEKLTFIFLVKDGQYFPGLMHIVDWDTLSSEWYSPSEEDPTGGACGRTKDGASLAFTLGGDGQNSDGITLCPKIFEGLHLQNLGEPIPDGGLAEITWYDKAGGTTMLHEFVHLVDKGMSLLSLLPLESSLTSSKSTTHTSY